MGFFPSASLVVTVTLQLILMTSPVFVGYLAWRCVRAYEMRGASSREQLVGLERMRYIEERLDDLLRRQARLEEDHRLLSSAMTTRMAERGARAG